MPGTGLLWAALMLFTSFTATAQRITRPASRTNNRRGGEVCGPSGSDSMPRKVSAPVWFEDSYTQLIKYTINENFNNKPNLTIAIVKYVEGNAPAGYAMIGSEQGMSCETNNDNVTLTGPLDRVEFPLERPDFASVEKTKDGCHTMCLKTSSCKAFDWYNNTLKCFLYANACTKPTKAVENGNTYRLIAPVPPLLSKKVLYHGPAHQPDQEGSNQEWNMTVSVHEVCRPNIKGCVLQFELTDDSEKETKKSCADINIFSHAFDTEIILSLAKNDPASFAPLPNSINTWFFEHWTKEKNTVVTAARCALKPGQTTLEQPGGGLAVSFVCADSPGYTSDEVAAAIVAEGGTKISDTFASVTITGIQVIGGAAANGVGRNAPIALLTMLPALLALWTSTSGY